MVVGPEDAGSGLGLVPLGRGQGLLAVLLWGPSWGQATRAALVVLGMAGTWSWWLGTVATTKATY